MNTDDDDPLKLTGTLTMADDGYTKLCPSCSKRWDCQVGLIGQEREIALKSCAKCSEPKISDYFRFRVSPKLKRALH